MENMQWEHYLMIRWLYEKLFKTKEGGLEIINIQNYNNHTFKKLDLAKLLNRKCNYLQYEITS